MIYLEKNNLYFKRVFLEIIFFQQVYMISQTAIDGLS